MKKCHYAVFILTVLPLVVLAAWVLDLSYERYELKHEVRVAVRGYDPRDLLSGHYLNLQTNWEKTDCSQFEGNICPKEEFLDIYKFFIPEDAAENLDSIISRNSDNLTFELGFKYKKGKKPLLKDLWIDGQKWSKWYYNNYNFYDIPADK